MSRSMRGWVAGLAAAACVLALWPRREAAALIEVEAGPCTIIIAAVADTSGTIRDDEQGRADEQRIAEALEAALQNSTDMQDKYEEACTQRQNRMRILVWRDNPNLYLAAANIEFADFATLQVDLGDLDSVGDHLSGSANATEVVEDSMLTRSLAHEMDHLRDPPTGPRSHADPAGRAGLREQGPAVEDENQVLTDLGIMADRRTYIGVRRGNVGALIDVVLPSGNRRSVFWNVQSHHEETRQEATDGDGSDLIRVPARLDDLPYMTCPGLHCFPARRSVDRDLDGVLDENDNCPRVVNPQQGDRDGDSTGDACDAS